jgi:dipeptidyl aminopeptidase/acylaminoacyl peptidase
MRRALPFFFAAALLPCGAWLFAAALAAPAAFQSAGNVNGNTNRAAGPAPASETPASNSNTNSNPDPAPNPVPHSREAGPPIPRRPAAPPSMRWTPVNSTPGHLATSPITLRKSASANAPVATEVDVSEYPSIEVLEVAGDFLRIRFETSEGEGRPRRRAEGWAAWGEALPFTTALVIDPRDGRVLRRVALGPGIDSVAFSPDGRRALFHGRWAPSVYEADASDLVPTRRLEADVEGSFGPAAYAGTGRDLLVPFRATTEGSGVVSLHLTRADGGDNVTAAPATPSPGGAEPAVVAFAPDGRTGFAFYRHPYGDEDESAADADAGQADTVEVFDTSTAQPVRRFKLPDPALAFEDGSLAMNADGSELYLLDHTGQRLVVVETQAGSVAREIPLGRGAACTFAFAPQAVGGAGMLVRYWEHGGDEHHHADAGILRLDGWRVVPDDSHFTFTAEAGGTLYAVDDNGTHLFTLGDDRRPRSDRELNRPDGLQTPVGLFATPDGSRLILLLTIPEGGC